MNQKNICLNWKPYHFYSVILLLLILAETVMAQPQIGSMNLLGMIQQGTVILENTSKQSSSTSDFTFRQVITFTEPFKKMPYVLLTIQSIQRLSGQSNSFAASVNSVMQQSFEIQFDNFFRESSFHVQLFFLAFESNQFVQVHHFSATSTQLLSAYKHSNVESEKIAVIPFSSKPVFKQSTAFLLGVKTTQIYQEDLAISVSTKANQQDNFIEVYASSWNKVNVDQVWIIILTWFDADSFQGNWQHFIKEENVKQYSNHVWTDKSSENRFANLEMHLSITNNMTSYSTFYGMSALDMRQGPLSLIVKQVSYNIKDQLSQAQVGTIGDVLLIGVSVNSVILGDIKEGITDQDESIDPIVTTAVIACILVLAFVLFSFIYLKYFAQPDPFSHQELPSPSKDPITNSPDISNNISPLRHVRHDSEKLNLRQKLTKAPSVVDTITLEFPEKLDLKQQIGKQVLLSKDLLTGVKFTEKTTRCEIKDSVIIEQANEASTKSQSLVLHRDRNPDRFKELTEKHEQYQITCNNHNEKVTENTEDEDELYDMKEYPKFSLLTPKKDGIFQALDFKQKNSEYTPESNTDREMN